MKATDFKTQIKFPDRVQPEDLPVLLQAARQGHQGAINRLIEGHMILAHNIAGRYLTVLGGVGADELYSAALEGLVVAVNNLPTHDNLVAYLTVTIHSYVERKGILKPLPVREYLDTQGSTMEIQELLHNCASDDFDLIILDMLSQGYTQQEIASSRGITQQAIAKRIKRIRERYIELAEQLQ